MKPRRDTVVVCAAAFGVLAVTILGTHATGEGDATLHFLNARDAVASDWEVVLTSWARPLFKALIIGPAWLGMTWARLFVALLSAVLVGQTIGLARDLELERPLLAGFFLLAPPFAFFAAQDVLSEIPTALMTYGALRLWLHGRHALSCVLVSLIPVVRPEGYFFIALWAVLLVLQARRFTLLPLLALGTAGWMLVCWWKTSEPTYPFMSFWPAGGLGFGHGHVWDYLARWPWFMGSTLFPIFLVGFFTAWRRELTLVWVLWWLVLGLHSVLWWRGLFASAGLLRIMVVIAPSTALLTLVGFNTLANRLSRRARAGFVAVTLGAVAFSTAQRYLHDLDHQEEKLAWPAAEFIARSQLLHEHTPFFSVNPLVLVALDYPKTEFERLHLQFDKRSKREVLRALPAGTVGVWDNGASNEWLGVTIEDLPALGYEQLAEFSETVEISNPWHLYQPWRAPDVRHLRYVVVRKVTNE